MALIVFVAILGTTFVLLGRWQLNRLAERRHNNALVVAHENAPTVPFRDTFHGTISNDAQWQRVVVTGTFDDAQTIQVRYRSNNGKKGPEFVTPLHADDGRTVLVDRGYAASAGGQEPSAPPAPSGTVTITGYMRRDEQGPAKARFPQNRQARLIDAPAIGTTLPYPIVDGYLSAIDPMEPGLTAVPTPALDEGPHLSYAIQWFCFCALAVAGVVVFIRGDIRDSRRAKAKSDAAVAPRTVASAQPAEENTTPPSAEAHTPSADDRALNAGEREDA